MLGVKNGEELTGDREAWRGVVVTRGVWMTWNKPEKKNKNIYQNLIILFIVLTIILY